MTGRRLLAAMGAVALVAVAAIVVAAIALSDSDGGDGGATAAPSVGEASTINEIYRREGPSVYFVQARGSEGAGTGTAWLYDDKGHLVTNEHVISAGTEVALRVGDNQLVPARIVGEDASTDLAVLEADRSALNDAHPLRLGDADKVYVGQPVVAIGNPFGLVDTVTSGIVSAKQRVLQAPNGYPIANVIQADAAINPGNSGGPLLDMGGRVIGVNSQIATGGAQQSAGIGFAVPVDTVKDIAQQLIEHGRVDRAFLGVSSVALTPDLARELGLNRSSGALVLEVAPGGPAARAGLHGAQAGGGEGALIAGGDVIVAIDGQDVTGPDDIARMIGAKKPGQTAKVTYVRGGSEHTVAIELTAQASG